MKFGTGYCLTALCAAADALSAHPGGNHTNYPKNWAVALFNSVDTIDVFGPINVLFYLSFSKQMSLSFVAETKDPIWMRPGSETTNKLGSQFMASVNPSHTFADPPNDIDVLLVPGGPGVRNSTLSDPVVAYIRKAYPNVKQLVTICSGAGLAARAGVLDGKRATTGKAAWNSTTAMGPKVNWVSPARWTVDGNVWTSSGVTSGFDLIFEFIDKMYGNASTKTLEGVVEYDRAVDPCEDSFAALHGVPPSGNCRAGKRAAPPTNTKAFSYRSANGARRI